MAENVENHVPLVVALQQLELLTLKKFIKNGAKAFKGMTELEKTEVWSLNILKNFKPMELAENHWMRLASYMFEEETTF